MLSPRPAQHRPAEGGYNPSVHTSADWKMLMPALLMLQASPFFEVQAPGGSFAQAEADVEQAFGRAAAWAAGPVKLERAGSHLVIKVAMACIH